MKFLQSSRLPVHLAAISICLISLNFSAAAFADDGSCCAPELTPAEQGVDENGNPIGQIIEVPEQPPVHQEPPQAPAENPWQPAPPTHHQPPSENPWQPPHFNPPAEIIEVPQPPHHNPSENPWQPPHHQPPHFNPPAHPLPPHNPHPGFPGWPHQPPQYQPPAYPIIPPPVYQPPMPPSLPPSIPGYNQYSFTKEIRKTFKGQNLLDIRKLLQLGSEVNGRYVKAVWIAASSPTGSGEMTIWINKKQAVWFSGAMSTQIFDYFLEPKSPMQIGSNLKKAEVLLKGTVYIESITVELE